MRRAPRPAAAAAAGADAGRAPRPVRDREPREPREPRAPRAPREPRETDEARREGPPLYWVFVARAPREARREIVQEALAPLGIIKVVTYQRGFYYVGFETEAGQANAIANSEKVSVLGEPVVIEKRMNFRPLTARRRAGAEGAAAADQ
jgi:hypothetical protein